MGEWLVEVYRRYANNLTPCSVAKKMSEVEALVIFNAIDTNGDGELTPLELSTRLSDFGMSDDQVIYFGNLHLHAMYVRCCC